MRTAEKQTSYTAPQAEYAHNQEREPTDTPDSLRSKLLGDSSESGAWIPRNTIAFRLNAEALQDGKFPDLVNFVDPATRSGFKEKSQEGSVEVLDWPKQLRTLDVDNQVDKHFYNTDHNVTLLYGQEAVAGEDEVMTPSAVLVHELLTEEQIADLRAQLPEGVPLIDVKTNELLDDVGKATREQLHRKRRIHDGLADAALRDLLAGYANGYSGARQHSAADDGMDDVWRDFYSTKHAYEEKYKAGNFKSTGHDYREAPSSYGHGRQTKGGDGARYGRSDSDFKGDFKRETNGRTATPESEEVRSHRERVEKAEGLLNEAAAKYGANSWKDLDPRDQERARRQVFRDVHPDRNGGERKLFQEVEFMTQGIKRPEPEAGKSAEGAPSAEKTPDAETSSAETPEAPAPPPEPQEQTPAETTGPLAIEAADSEEAGAPEGKEEAEATSEVPEES